MTLVTVYGRYDAKSSYASVTDGWLRYLLWAKGQGHDFDFRAMEMEGITERSVKPTDVLAHPGRVALVTDPHQLGAAAFFSHEVIYLVIAPHTPFIPATYLHLMQSLGPRLRLLPPSEYSAGCLRRLGFEDVVVVEHGVSSDLSPLSCEQHEAIRRGEGVGCVRQPGFNLLHLSESNADRKGTYVLLEAFDTLIREGLDVSLTIVAGGITGVSVGMQAQRLSDQASARVRVLPRVDAPAHKMRYLYGAFDALVQPSRVEGFGLCPLEALACGVPVVVTAATGHSQWLAKLQHVNAAIERVAVWAPEPMQDEPHPCPTVQAGDVVRAVQVLVSNEDLARSEATTQAHAVWENHSWMRVLRPIWNARETGRQIV